MKNILYITLFCGQALMATVEIIDMPVDIKNQESQNIVEEMKDPSVSHDELPGWIDWAGGDYDRFE